MNINRKILLFVFLKRFKIQIKIGDVIVFEQTELYENRVFTFADLSFTSIYVIV